MVIAVSGAALTLISLGQFGTAIAAQSLALAVLVANMLMTVAVPGKALSQTGACAPLRGRYARAFGSP